jgi:phosphatidylserine/phosphatidylglycerophosphate/cardiolipin synthase-like enzyme
MTTQASFVMTPAEERKFGRLVAAQLNSSCQQLPHDIQERLRASRTLALEMAQRSAALQTQLIRQGSSTAMLHLGDEGLNLFSRLASLLPLVALVAGLVLINNLIEDSRAGELAEVDSAMLTDDLPPTAYADPGFLQFLKMPLTPSESAAQDDAPH